MDRPAQGSESRNRQVIADLVAAGDPERWLAATYARRQARSGLAALFALDISLGRLVASTNEPMIGAIRIAWWREALEKLHQPPLPGEPVLQALAHEVTGGDAAKCAALAALTDGWLTLIEAETVDAPTLEAHAEQRGARLFALAAELLGADDAEGSLRQMGRGWALVDLASRLSRQKERADAVAMAADIFAEAPARVGGARPLIALGALARRDALSQLKNRRVGSPGRQLRMLRALLIGR